MSTTKNLAKYIKRNSINLSAVSRATGIQYPVLYASLGGKGRGRPLSVDEAILVCEYLNVNLLNFADKKEA